MNYPPPKKFIYLNARSNAWPKEPGRPVPSKKAIQEHIHALKKRLGMIGQGKLGNNGTLNGRRISSVGTDRITKPGAASSKRGTKHRHVVSTSDEYTKDDAEKQTVKTEQYESFDTNFADQNIKCEQELGAEYSGLVLGLGSTDYGGDANFKTEPRF